MSINGIGACYPAWHETGKLKKNSNSGTGFADSMADAGMAGTFYFQKTSTRRAGQNAILEAYRASASAGVSNVKPSYEKYESENYKIVPDNELKEALQNVMGTHTLEMETLQGYTLKTHSGTGIQYIIKDGEEGRGGKTLLQSEADRKRFEELAETYYNKYPGLIESKEEAYTWADLEIRGLAQHTNNGIISMGYDGMSYNDNLNFKNNWTIRFSKDTYKLIFEWLQNNRENIGEMQIKMFCRRNL